MRTRLAVFTIFAVSLALGAPHAGATVSTSASSYEQMSMSYNSFDPDTNEYRDGYFFVYREVKAVGTDASVTPSVVVKAASGSVLCDEDGCDGESFPLQNVAATAFSLDPLGNAPRFTECLAPTSGPCKQFDLTLSKPDTLQISGCSSLPACANAWHDPGDGSSEASAGLGLFRWGYDVAGTWAGSTFTPPDNGMFDAMTWRALGASAGVAP
jgi:hypothetical protein